MEKERVIGSLVSMGRCGRSITIRLWRGNGTDRLLLDGYLKCMDILVIIKLLLLKGKWRLVSL